MASAHQIGGEEMRALRALKRDDPAGRFVFMSERGGPISRHIVSDALQVQGTARGFGKTALYFDLALFFRVNTAGGRP
jgi:hypothetical protein